VETKRRQDKITLNVFDIDDTLFYTQAKVRVIKNGKLSRELNSHEFSKYKLSSNEKYDFTNFRNAYHFRSTAQPIEKMLDMAKRIVYNNERSETILLTAREDFDDRDTFLATFRDHGFPIDKVYVERAGNLGRFNAKITANIAKMVILRKYIGTGKYNRIRVFDDSEKNLRSILKLAHLHSDLKVDAYIVYNNGSFEKYHTRLRG